MNKQILSNFSAILIGATMTFLLFKIVIESGAIIELVNMLRSQSLWQYAVAFFLLMVAMIIGGDGGISGRPN
jgi:hypothetical protein